MVVDQIKTRLVEDSTGVSLSNGKTNGIGKTLTERSSGHLNAGGIVGLGVARSDAVDLLPTVSLSLRAPDERKTYSEILEVVQRHLVSEQVDKSILEHAAMAVPCCLSVFISKLLTFPLHVR